MQEKIRALLQPLAGRRVAIVGFGREGLSSYRLLRRVFPEMPLLVADRNPVTLPGDDPRTRVVTGEGYLDACRDCDVLLKSPGIPTFDLDPALTAKMTCQTHLFLRALGAQTVGVTGTKGKSTTSSLLHHVLRAAGRDARLVGNIGAPVFDSLEDATAETVFVSELSCHQLEDSPASPRTAVLLNLHEEHLDHYGTVERYYAAKKQIFRHQGPGDFLLYDYGNPHLAPAEIPAGVEALTYSVADPAADLLARDGTLRLRTPGGVHTLSLDPARVPLRGAHNFGNIGVVYAVARRFGVPDDTFRRAVETFRGLPHRLEPVGVFGGVEYFDDSISTIPATAIAGVESLGNVGCLILGGMERGIDYTPLADFLAARPVPVVVLLPDTGPRLLALLRERGVAGRLLLARDLPDAVALARRWTKPGTQCLFSPAAASYHAYRNFEERGRHFQALLRGE